MNKVLEAIELLSRGNGNSISNSDSYDQSENQVGNQISCDGSCGITSDILIAAKTELERAFRDLENQKAAFRYEMELKQKTYESQMKLFNMKWELLEEETRKLAEESKKAEKRRAFFERVNSYQKSNSDSDNIVHGEMFFKGVASPQALKKRYKDLIKIYHPDAEFGDNQTVQEINREYDSLRHAMAK